MLSTSAGHILYSKSSITKTYWNPLDSLEFLILHGDEILGIPKSEARNEIRSTYTFLDITISHHIPRLPPPLPPAPEKESAEQNFSSFTKFAKTMRFIAHFWNPKHATASESFDSRKFHLHHTIAGETRRWFFFSDVIVSFRPHELNTQGLSSHNHACLLVWAA